MEPDSSHYELEFGPKTYEIDDDKISQIASSIQELLGLKTFQLSVDFISPEEMTRLNSEYRGKEKSTDVLSFPQTEFEAPITVEKPYQDIDESNGPPQLLGDIAISLVDAESNSENIGQSLDREVCFLLVHGILHLCGHDHMESEEEKLMLHQQKQIMASLEDSEPPPHIWNQCARSKA